MQMNEEYSKAERHAAEHPHQLFVFNTVGNHVLLFIITVSIANVNPAYTLLVPLISLLIVTLSFLSGAGAPRSTTRPCWCAATGISRCSVSRCC